MPIKYPRTCNNCQAEYKHQPGFHRHITNGTCQRKQAPQSFGQSHCGQEPIQTINNITTQNITNNNAPVNDNETLQLQEKIKQLEIQSAQQQEAYQALLNNDVLPLLGKDDDYIYVLQERHAMDMRLPVYKVGVTSEIHRRTGQYARGSKLLFCRVYQGGKKREAALHQHLRSLYKQRTDFGTEFVEGDGNKIIDDVIKFMGDAADH